MLETFHSCLRKQEEIKKLFLSCSSPEEKYQKLIELGRMLPVFPEEWKTPDNLVSGCQSQVFLQVSFENRKVIFKATADALISAGLVALLTAVYNDEPPEAIIGCPPRFLEDLGIQAALTPGRSHGLMSIHLRMKKESIKYLTLNQNFN